MKTLLFYPEHRYSLAATGIKFRYRDFASRQAANEYMYKEMNKRGLKVEKIYDDKHCKTYICQNNIRFYVNRY